LPPSTASASELSKSKAPDCSELLNQDTRHLYQLRFPKVWSRARV
jgi:hypothetical protein